MKKIAVITNSISGLYHFRFELIEALAQKNLVTIYAPLKSSKTVYKERFKKKEVEVKNIILSSHSKNIFQELSTLKEIKRIKNKKYDYILTYTIKPNIYTSLFFKQKKTKVIPNVTGLGSSILDRPSSITSKILLKLYTESLNKNDINFVQNNFIRKKLIENNPKLENKIKLIPGSGVNLERYYYEAYPKIEHNTIKILFVGRIIKSKGISELLEAANTVQKLSTNYSYQFLIAGYLSKDYEDLHFNRNVRYVGAIEDPKKVYSKVHFVINPSYHEGMSNVLLEAAATGRPLLASDIPGCREIVSNNNGFLFESRNSNAIVDSILKIDSLSHKDFEEMGKRSRELVEKEFDRQIVVDKYLEVIENE